MATRTLDRMTVGVFETRDAAERAVADLRAAGYRDDEISVVAKNESGEVVHTDATGHNNAADGAALGVAAGAGVGALASLAVSFGVIPVIGPVLAAGPIAAAVFTGAATAAAGGIAGALIGAGIPEEDARYYEGEVNAGRYVVMVDRGARTRDDWEIFSRHGGYNRAYPRV
jgi:hypothetical protein